MLTHKIIKLNGLLAYVFFYKQDVIAITDGFYYLIFQVGEPRAQRFVCFGCLLLRGALSLLLRVNHQKERKK